MPTPAVPHSCCTDFVRAGRGLPAIEPGMPTPAGTGLTRRSLVTRAVGGALAVYGASKLPLAALEEGIAQAATGNRVLLSVYLPGGVDGLSVLAPVRDPHYASLRPTLKLAAGSGGAFAEDDRLMWHPAADALRVLHEEGKVSVLPAVGMSDNDTSHFTSRHFWEVGATDVGEGTGWLGRYLDVHGSADNPLQGISLDSALSPALAAATAPVAAVPEPEASGLWTQNVWDAAWEGTVKALDTLAKLPTSDPALAAARRATLASGSVHRQLAPLQGGVKAPVTYPETPFAQRLRQFAGMLQHGLPVRVATVYGVGGYDTHADQARTFAPNLAASCEALLAFQRDLEARGLADRVLIHVWSEFGRRARQNQTGTDHGAAGVGFVIGARARGTQVGEFPGLATLDPHGNVRSTADFRSVYCSLLEQWLDADAERIVPGAGSFRRHALVRG